MDNIFSEQLRTTAEEFLISEFQAPLESTDENDYGMYEYRRHLIDVAYWLLGGVQDGQQNEEKEDIKIIEDLDDDLESDEDL